MIRFHRNTNYGKDNRIRIREQVKKAGITNALVCRSISRSCECGGWMTPAWMFAEMDSAGYSPWRYTCPSCGKTIDYKSYGITNLPPHVVVEAK